MKIISVNEDLTSSEPFMGERYFELDGVPDTEWINVFTELHRQELDLMKRRVRIQNTWIVVQCPMEEMQHQIDSLNVICKKTTEAIEAARVRKEEAESQRLGLEAEKKQKASDHFKSLNFNKE
jgi:hypothetical protein